MSGDFRAPARTDADKLSTLHDHAIDAEQAVLGALMYDQNAWAFCQGLKPELFHEPLHARLFEQAAKLLREGKRADPILLTGMFPSDPAFEEMGGVSYLADLIDHAPPTGSVDSFVEAMTENWARRAILAVSTEARQAVLEGHGSLELAAGLRATLESVEAMSAPEGDNVISARDAQDRLFDILDDEIAAGKQRGLMTGLRCVDRRLGGLKPGWLVIIGARPSMGKTALARCIMQGAAERNPYHDFGFFAVEMAERELTERALSAESWRLSIDNIHASPIPYQDIGNGKVNPMELSALRREARRAPGNFYIDDRSTLTFDDVVRRTHALKRKAEAAGRTLGAICIDYLQLMKLYRRPGGPNDASLWGEITSGLKRLAGELGICIVLLSQLSRDVEKRDDKRPQLSDLRESGAIEQDANAVLFPFHEHYYLVRAEPKAGSKGYDEWEMRVQDTRDLMDVIAAKVRQGAVGTDHQTYRAAYDVIEDRREQPR